MSIKREQKRNKDDDILRKKNNEMEKNWIRNVLKRICEPIAYTTWQISACEL